MSVPIGLLRVLSTEAPRLQAEEALLAAQAAAIGTGSMEARMMRSTLSHWHRLAAGHTRHEKPKADPMVLASMGIALRVQEPASGD